LNGAIDLLFPICSGIDGILAAVNIPVALRILLWGCASGGVTMGLYALLSPQSAIRAQNQALKGLSARMRTAQDGEFQEVLQLSLANLRQSLNLLRMVFAPTLLSSFPVLVIILWLSAYYSYQLPDARAIAVSLSPPTADVRVVPERWVQQSEDGTFTIDLKGAASIQFLDDIGSVYTGLPLQPPTAVLYPKRWWNVIVGNQAGYLRKGAQLETLRFHFDELQVIPGVPNWIGNWKFLFFPMLMLTALGLKIALKLE
jgi:hypothetical protein